MSRESGFDGPVRFAAAFGSLLPRETGFDGPVRFGPASCGGLRDGIWGNDPEKKKENLKNKFHPNPVPKARGNDPEKKT